MKTFGSLGLLAALTLGYYLYFQSQPSSAQSGADESRVLAVTAAPARPGDWKSASAPHSAYKADLDRAHDAARLMQASHDEANGE